MEHSTNIYNICPLAPPAGETEHSTNIYKNCPLAPLLAGGVGVLSSALRPFRPASSTRSPAMASPLIPRSYRRTGPRSTGGTGPGDPTESDDRSGGPERPRDQCEEEEEWVYGGGGGGGGGGVESIPDQWRAAAAMLTKKTSVQSGAVSLRSPSPGTAPVTAGRPDLWSLNPSQETRLNL
ncbi:hypothetical protein CRUP_013321 [Coryphaenoides rupestris]|nr:hypothetical protein CRUP_013321 [Coryphaenoides rupestris]